MLHFLRIWKDYARWAAHLDSAEDGKSCSILQDVGGNVTLWRVVANPREGSHNVCGFVDVRLQGAAQRGVEPGSHGAAVCHIINCGLHSLADSACIHVLSFQEMVRDADLAHRTKGNLSISCGSLQWFSLVASDQWNKDGMIYRAPSCKTPTDSEMISMAFAIPPVYRV